MARGPVGDDPYVGAAHDCQENRSRALAGLDVAGPAGARVGQRRFTIPPELVGLFFASSRLEPAFV